MKFLTLNNKLIGFAIFAFAITISTRAQADLIVNGDFSAGNSGFTNDYTAVPTNFTVHTSPGDYGVVANPATAFTPPGYDSYTDHTTGTGLMLFVDASTNSSDAFWRETPTLSANTTYTFSYFITATDATNLPKTSVLVNGTPIDTGFQVTEMGGGANWQNVTETFTTTGAGSYTLSMVDLVTANIDNDFTVDDISLNVSSNSGGGSNVPDSGSTMVLLAVGLVGLAAARRCRDVTYRILSSAHI